MVIDTVHSSGGSRLHGRTGWMKIARPFHSLQGSEAKRLVHSTGMVDKKGIDLDRPGLVRRRIMIRPPEEPHLDDEAGELSNTLKSSTATSMNRFHYGKMDRTKHGDAFARSPTKKSPKKLRLFDLNKLPNLPNVMPIASPTSTIDSVDSTTHVILEASPVMATRSIDCMADTDVFFSPSARKRFRDEGDVRGGALAVDLGLLQISETQRQSTEGARHGKAQRCANQAASRKPQVTDDQPCEAENLVRLTSTNLPTPTRKRLRKLSEYAGGHSSTTTSMAKSWTTDDGDVCNGDVTKTLASSPQPDAKVHLHNDDNDDAPDEEQAFGAASALLMLSSSTSLRRDLSFSSAEFRHSPSSSPNGNSSFAPMGDDLDDEEKRQTPAGSCDMATSDSTSRSLGSGSVLLRPSNKQRFKSMVELLAQTPILRQVRA